MIIPRFTVRRLLAITAVVAVFFAIVSMAIRGAASSDAAIGPDAIERRAANPAFFAAGISIAVGAVAASGLTFAGFFLAAWLASEITGLTRSSQTAKSPFAEHTPAPVLLPPEEPT